MNCTGSNFRTYMVRSWGVRILRVNMVYYGSISNQPKNGYPHKFSNFCTTTHLVGTHHKCLDYTLFGWKRTLPGAIEHWPTFTHYENMPIVIISPGALLQVSLCRVHCPSVRPSVVRRSSLTFHVFDISSWTVSWIEVKLSGRLCGNMEIHNC